VPPDLQAEAVDVLGRLIRFNTVNPPGNEREAIEWLAAYLGDAGLECEIDGAVPERPNLVASLKGGEGPVLGYLGHVDTVLADPGDWSRDPWSGEVHDGHLGGRGALDMKSQVAAEAVAAAHLARSGWRPNGELKLFAVADEEVGGELGAKWLTENRPDLARCDYLINEGAGAVMPFGDRRLFGVCCAEKGTFRFRVRTRGAAGHASVPGIADNALLKLAPILTRLAEADLGFDVTDEPRRLLEMLGLDAEDPQGAIAAVARTDPRLAAMLDPTLRVTVAPTRIFASEKINVIPAHAELHVDCRAPAGMETEAVRRRVAEVIGDADFEFFEQVVGNRSPAESPLFDAIAEWIGDEGEAVPVVLPAFTDSRWWRAAFPDCIAYGFFPMRHTSLYDAWPLIHGADERIDVRDLGFAAEFFAWLPPTLLS
jgi:acetylornithine deacetylase/succinyl-diaminopimelate desuccinylase-like protein